MNAPMASLVAHLRAMSDEALLELVQRRPDLAVPAPSDLLALSRRAALPYSVVRAVEQLDLLSAQVMETVVALGSTSEEELRARTANAAPWTSVAQALTSLEALALVWRDGTGETIDMVACLPQVVPNPLGLGRTASDLLELVPNELARGILAAQKRTLDEAGLATSAGQDSGRNLVTHHARLGEHVAAALQEPRTLAALLSAAPDVAVDALTSVASGGTSVGQVSDAMTRVPDPDSDNPVTWLISRGLLVAVADNAVELPREVGMAVRQEGLLLTELAVTPPTPSGPSYEPAQVDATGAGSAADYLRHTVDVLELWSQDPPTMLRTGGLGIREIRRSAKAADLTEDALALVAATAYTVGLVDTVTPEGDPDTVLLPTTSYDVWLDHDDAQRWRMLAEGWLQMRRWPALSTRAEPGARASLLSSEDIRADAPATRVRVLRVLADLPEGRSADADLVPESVRWHQPYGSDAFRSTRTVLTEAALLGLTGRGALTAAGRLLLAGEAGAATEAMRAALPVPVDHILAQADHTLIAPGPLRPDLSRSLAMLADRESTGAATVYRVTETSLRRGLDAGMSSGDIQELLRTRSRTPVPQSLTYLVEDTARRYGRLRLGPAAAYVRCDDEAHLSEVLADRRLKGLLLRRLSPTVLVADLSLARSLDLLRDAGYAPVAESADGSPVLGRAEPTRAPPEARFPGRSATARGGHVPTHPGTADPETLSTLVARLRRADRALLAAERVRTGQQGPASPSSKAEVRNLLTTAAQRGHAVWISYVDRSGMPTHRIVEPTELSGNLLIGYDHLRSEMRTFLVERMVSVVALDAPAADVLGGES